MSWGGDSFDNPTFTIMNLVTPTLIAAGLATSSALALPVEWNGHFYEYVPAPQIDWLAASALAQSSSHNGWAGHLATLTTEAENTFVATLVDGIESYPGDPWVDAVLAAWVGGFQDPVDEADPARGWTWVNGEGPIPGVNGAVPFGNWYVAEPNDWLGPQLENHLAIWGSAGYGNTIGSWNDEGGLWNISGFIVEYEPGRSVADSGSGVGLIAVAMIGLLGLRGRVLGGVPVGGSRR